MRPPNSQRYEETASSSSHTAAQVTTRTHRRMGGGVLKADVCRDTQVTGVLYNDWSGGLRLSFVVNILPHQISVPAFIFSVLHL